MEHSTPTRVLGLGVAALLSIACAATSDGSASNEGSGGGSDKPAATLGVDSGSVESVSCTPGDSRACYDGPAEFRGVGICVEGTQSCGGSGEFGSWGECLGDVAPSDTPTGTCSCAPEMVGEAGPVLPDLTPTLCGGPHTECDCGKAGGELVDIGESCKICRFQSSACPESWSHYDNWRTSVDGPTDCGILAQYATGPSGAEEDCPPFVPGVSTSSGTYMLACDRQATYCCGTPPAEPKLTKGKPWSSHLADEKSWSQGYNACGCACAAGDACTQAMLSCIAPTTEVGCS